jgi:hypothetical protein
MRSIRLSLILYFLILLAAALGAVSWFVSGSSAQMVRKSEDSKRELLKKQYEDRVKEAKAAFDNRLLTQAETLAKFARWTHDHYEALAPVGVLCSAVQPQGHLHTPLWLSEALDPMLAFGLWRNIPVEISLDEDVFHGGDGGGTGYYQISSPDGRPMECSESLEDYVLPLHKSVLTGDPLKERYEDLTLPSGAQLRVVTIKRVLRFRPPSLPEPPPSLRWPPGPGPGPGPVCQRAFPPAGTAPRSAAAAPGLPSVCQQHGPARRHLGAVPERPGEQPRQ